MVERTAELVLCRVVMERHDYSSYHDSGDCISGDISVSLVDNRGKETSTQNRLRAEIFTVIGDVYLVVSLSYVHMLSMELPPAAVVSWEGIWCRSSKYDSRAELSRVSLPL